MRTFWYSITARSARHESYPNFISKYVRAALYKDTIIKLSVSEPTFAWAALRAAHADGGSVEPQTGGVATTTRARRWRFDVVAILFCLDVLALPKKELLFSVILLPCTQFVISQQK